MTVADFGCMPETRKDIVLALFDHASEVTAIKPEYLAPAGAPLPKKKAPT